jgi:hypothetical protein
MLTAIESMPPTGCATLDVAQNSGTCILMVFYERLRLHLLRGVAQPPDDAQFGDKRQH